LYNFIFAVFVVSCSPRCLFTLF